MILGEQPFFSIGATQYVGEHLVSAGRRWGEWARLETEVREGLACMARAEDDGEAVGDDELDAAAAEFRYERELVTQEEMEAWLASWSLSVEDWTDYLSRFLLRRRWKAELVGIVAEHPVDPDEIEAVIEGDAVCAGYVSRIALELAARAAAHQRARNEGWVGHAPRNGPDGWLDDIDDGFGAFRARILAPSALADRVAAHRLDWVLVSAVTISFPTMDGAREAALCVRDDGMAIEEVARASGAALEHVSRYLEEIDPAQHAPFLAATAGDVLGPLPVDDRFLVLQVRDKVLPSLANPAVRRRAEESVLRTALEHEVTRRVKWHRRV